jgi:hypothetical protein
MRVIWGGNHVQHTLPHLVEAAQTRAAPALKQLLEPCSGRIQNQRTHRTTSVPAPALPLLARDGMSLPRAGPAAAEKHGAIPIEVGFLG